MLQLMQLTAADLRVDPELVQDAVHERQALRHMHEGRREGALQHG